MAVINATQKELTLKVVYYGCALGGKTTNLITLHRLTDPESVQGLVSIATQDDRTLFFDLLPMELGRVSGLDVRVKVYTVPGQVHYETTRRQVLAGADGVVLVVDSSTAAAKSNSWAAENLRFNLKQNGLDPNETPLVLQWNKRDLPDARPIEEMAAELNPRGLPAFAAVATTGAGVVDTFEDVVTRSIVHAYRHASTGRHPELAEVAATVKAALAETSARQPALADATAATPSPPVAPPRAKAPADASPESVLPYGFEHRVDMDAYKEKWAEEGRDRRIMDTETLLSEAVESNMKLAERLDGYARIEEQGERRARMMQALGWLAPLLADAAAPALPEGMLEMLAKACGRSRASFLLFRPSEAVMEERALYGHPVDPLNSVLAAGAGSAAHRASQAASPRLLEDLRSEMFSDGLPPQAEGLEGALVLPLVCDGAAFGSVVVYVAAGEPTLDDAEREFWSTTAVLLSLSLHWRALRQKLAGERRAAR